jgi:hypothetical protein
MIRFLLILTTVAMGVLPSLLVAQSHTGWFPADFDTTRYEHFVVRKTLRHTLFKQQYPPVHSWIYVHFYAFAKAHRLSTSLLNSPSNTSPRDTNQADTMYSNFNEVSFITLSRPECVDSVRHGHRFTVYRTFLGIVGRNFRTSPMTSLIDTALSNYYSMLFVVDEHQTPICYFNEGAWWPWGDERYIEDAEHASSVADDLSKGFHLPPLYNKAALGRRFAGASSDDVPDDDMDDVDD